ncbi:MAG: hypothetical protein HKN48_01275 [Flavobacteriaceae bacterium]|nr:hypothetical protein [Flavobacteriaceae bacterium]
MKNLSRILLIMLMIGIVSCRDTKKEEEAETEAVIEQIEAVEAEAEEISEKINQEAEELEEALSELDSI